MELPEFLISLQEILGGLVQKYGPWGVALAMLVESAGVPFASTVVLLTAGGMILSGRAGFLALLLASAAGILSGSVVSYIMGFIGGSVGRVLGRRIWKRSRGRNPDPRSPASGKVSAFIEKYGTYSVFAGQLWGVTRTFISFPAGAMHMNFFVFIVSTALGGALFSLWIIGWSLVFTGTAGLLFRLLRTVTSLSPWIWPVLLLAAAALVYLYRTFFIKRWIKK